MRCWLPGAQAPSGLKNLESAPANSNTFYTYRNNCGHAGEVIHNILAQRPSHSTSLHSARFTFYAVVDSDADMVLVLMGMLL